MTENDFRWTTALVNEYACKLVMSKPGTGYTIQDFIKEKQSQDKQVGWEIVEFVTPFLGSNDVHFTRSNAGMFCTGLNGKFYEYTEERMIEEKRPIHSVRRLSDNEVFTIGDKITWGIHKDWESELTGFEIIEDRLKFYDSKLPQGRRPTDFVNALNLSKIMPPQPSSIDRIEVSTLVGKEKYADPRCTDFIYSFESNSIISPGNFPAIKQAIEAVLNGDTVVGINPCSVTGLFTNEQQDYVDSVRDCDLRAHLLHQVRLRDNMEADRNSFEKQLNETRIKHRAEVDTIREETWKAARIFNGFNPGILDNAQYPTLQDYLQTISENKPTQPSSTEDKGKVLFTTEDGIGISLNEMYYEVNSDYELRESKCWGRVTDNWNRSDIKTFYTKPNAERFILHNKCCLSLEDVLKIVRTVSDSTNGEDNKRYLNSRLQELVKQKLIQ